MLWSEFWNSCSRFDRGNWIPYREQTYWILICSETSKFLSLICHFLCLNWVRHSIEAQPGLCESSFMYMHIDSLFWALSFFIKHANVPLARPFHRLFWAFRGCAINIWNGQTHRKRPNNISTACFVEACKHRASTWTFNSPSNGNIITSVA